MSLTERKNAFLAVLAANLDHGVRDEVMRFWEKKYSTRPQFGVSAFLDELYSNYRITIKKGQLFRELSQAALPPLASWLAGPAGAAALDGVTSERVASRECKRAPGATACAPSMSGATAAPRDAPPTAAGSGCAGPALERPAAAVLRERREHAAVGLGRIHGPPAGNGATLYPCAECALRLRGRCARGGAVRPPGTLERRRKR